MHDTLVEIQGHLTKVVAQIQATLPNDEPFSIAHNNWSFPGLTRVELIEEAQSILQLIEEKGDDEIGEAEARLSDYSRRLKLLHSQTIPNIWGNPAAGVPVYMLTLDGLRKALIPALRRDGHAEAVTKLRSLTAKLRGMEARFNDLEPRTTSLTSMVERIELAYNAADQLPTDLESLSEARQKVEALLREATKDQIHLADVKENADEFDSRLKRSADDAKAVLERCETAYAAATSVGLAAAFTERSETLSRSMWFWIGGLVIALVAGSVVGTAQLQALSTLFKQPDVAASVVLLNLVLALLSVGAPVWFGWLATKQIGQRFRLAEDYAFKASISRAYEGFRREAARVDKEMEARLLASALSRLDEIPLRLVESATHGSPWHELASSDIVKEAIRAVPGFATQVKEMADRAVNTLSPKKPKIAAPSADEAA